MDLLERIVSRRFFLKLVAISTFATSARDKIVCLGEEVRPGAVEPSVEEALKAIDALNRTSAFQVDSERLAAFDVIQNSVDLLRASDYNAYYKSSEEEARKEEEKRAVLRFLNVSFDKVLREVQQTTVEKGVVFWHVYNMGYVVKTPTSTFAVDLKHRRACELVPFLDFLLITHRHGDHYDDALNAAFAASGKPVVSNFIDNEWKIPAEGREYEFGECRIKTRLVDHNAKLLNFVATFEIDCGRSSGNFVVYHVGDACDIRQLQPTTRVDVFIPHLAVGLDVPLAVKETIKPRTTLLSHILELGHLIDKWRWSYEYGRNICKKCESESVVLPVWGEKIVLEK